jgi:hypothetical protein
MVNAPCRKNPSRLLCEAKAKARGRVGVCATWNFCGDRSGFDLPMSRARPLTVMGPRGLAGRWFGSSRPFFMSASHQASRKGDRRATADPVDGFLVICLPQATVAPRANAPCTRSGVQLEATPRSSRLIANPSCVRRSRSSIRRKGSR